MKRIYVFLLAVLLTVSSIGLAETWVCPECGEQNEDRFCENCGAAKSTWTCPTCGKSNKKNFCGSCGTKRPDTGTAAYRAQFEAGETVTFGSYAGETIEWLVLEADGDKRVLISAKGLEAKPYNTEETSVTWEDCSLRQWLNGEFYNTAFSAEEQAMIETTHVTADKNPKYSTDPGNDTEDKVYLLSIAEANKYFADDEARACGPTPHAKSSGAWVNDKGACWWWLRSPGYRGDLAVSVYYFGSVYTFGHYATDAALSVRPVITLRLS